MIAALPVGWLDETANSVASLPTTGWAIEQAGAATLPELVGQIFDDVPTPAAVVVAMQTASDPMIQFSYTRITETTDKDGNVTKFTDVVSEEWDEAQLAAKRQLELPAPVYVSGPGHFAQDSLGSLLSMDAAGAIYADGRQLKGVAAAKFAVVGRSIYALGKTVPSWWLWTGTGWSGPITAFDPNILL